MTSRVRRQVKITEWCYGFTGKMARCTYTWRADDEDGKVFMISIPGCLVLRRTTGELEFRLPKTNIGNRSVFMASISPDARQEIEELVRGSNWNDEIGAGRPKAFRNKKPAEVIKGESPILGDDIEPLEGENDDGGLSV